MKYLMLAALLVGCHGKHAPARDDAAVSIVLRDAPHEAPIAAATCPGQPADCSACDAGSGAACFTVALAQEADDAKFHWYERGCKLGHVDSCAGVSWYYTFHGSHEDFLRAQARENEVGRARVIDEQKRCGAGDEEACEQAAASLAAGLYIAKDLAAARALLDPPCTAGKAHACLELASFELPVADKLRYGKRGCTLGDARQCGDLVGLFDDTPPAPGQGGFARAELTRMCTAKQADACWVLGGLYVTGKGGAKDRGRGAAYVTTACTLDPSFCDTRDRLAKGGAFFDAGLENVPKLDVGPLIDATKRRPH